MEEIKYSRSLIRECYTIMLLFYLPLAILDLLPQTSEKTSLWVQKTGYTAWLALIELIAHHSCPKLVQSSAPKHFWTYEPFGQALPPEKHARLPARTSSLTPLMHCYLNGFHPWALFWLNIEQNNTTNDGKGMLWGNNRRKWKGWHADVRLRHSVSPVQYIYHLLDWN